MSCLDWFVKFLMEHVEGQPGDAGGIRDREAIPGDLEGPEADVVVRQVPVDTVRRQFQHPGHHLCQGPHTVKIVDLNLNS